MRTIFFFLCGYVVVASCVIIVRILIITIFFNIVSLALRRSHGCLCIYSMVEVTLRNTGGALPNHSKTNIWIATHGYDIWDLRNQFTIFLDREIPFQQNM